MPRAAAVLAHAFADEPTKLALFPDSNLRYHLTEAIARARLRASVPYAAAYVAELDGAIAGVALWHPPNVKPGGLSVAATFPALLLSGVRVLSLISGAAAALWRDRALMRTFASARNAAAKQAGGAPSWYLALLGTDPGHRGRGVARALLERTLERCDIEGLPVWLETTSDGNVTIYERFGFDTIAAIGGGAVLPDLWVMRREPRPRSAGPV